MVCHWPENEYSIGMHILISHASARGQATGGFGLCKFLLAIRGEKRSIPTVSKPRQKYWLRQVPLQKIKWWQSTFRVGSAEPGSHPKKNPWIFTAGHWARTWLPSWSWCLWCRASANLSAGVDGLKFPGKTIGQLGKVVNGLPPDTLFWGVPVPVRLGRDYIDVIAVSSWEEWNKTPFIRNGMWFIQFWILFQYWYSTPPAQQRKRGLHFWEEKGILRCLF